MKNQAFVNSRLDYIFKSFSKSFFNLKFAGFQIYGNETTQFIFTFSEFYAEFERN